MPKARVPRLVVSFLLALVAWAFPLAAQVMEDAEPAAPSRAVPASRQADNVAIITIKGGIDAITEMSVKRRIRQAEDSGADAMVFEIDSPGGEVGAVLEITNAIKASSITNTVAWVRPDAYSGGAIIALACREMVTSSPASFGDALPVVGGFGGVQRATDVIPPEKILPPLLTEVADSARRNGFDEYLAQAIVTDGIELWAAKHKDTGEWLFLNEYEYRLIFAGEPPRGRPVLTSVPKSATDMDAARSGALGERSGDSDADALPVDAPDAETGDEAESVADDDGDKDGSSADTAPSEGLGGMLESVEAVDPARAFRGATPEIAEIVERARADEGAVVDPAAVSTRPVLSAADAGTYVSPIYVSDGTGPIVMRDDQMRRFGLSTAIVDTDEQLRAYFGAKNMTRTDRSWSESLVAFLTMLPVRGVLIVVFLLALFIEMTSPGMVVPGGVALAALVALLAPPALIGMAGWWEIAAIGLGICLILIELLVLPGFGVFGVIGLVSLFGGLVGTFIPDGSGGLFPGGAAQTNALYGVATVVLATATAGVGVFFIAKHFGTIPFIGKLVLADGVARNDTGVEDDELRLAGERHEGGVRVGSAGVAVTPLRPSGTIDVEGEVVDAVSESGFIEADERVTIVARRGFSWVVESGEGGSA